MKLTKTDLSICNTEYVIENLLERIEDLEAYVQQLEAAKRG